MMLFVKIFLIIALSMIIVAFFFRKQTFDIHLSDTYYVVPGKAYFFGLAAALVIIAVLYLLAEPLLNPSLAWLHLASTAVAIISIIIISSLRPQRPIRFADVEAMNVYATYNSVLVIAMFILVFVQFTFVLNIGLGVWKLFKK